MSTPVLPPLPKIEGDVDLTLTVFTHSSLSGQSSNQNLYNADRLSELGQQALNLATTVYLYEKRPPLNSRDIGIQRENELNVSAINLWLEQYDLKTKLRAAPESGIYENPQMKKFFCTYVGAVFLNKGIKAVENWISQLLDPNFEPSYSASSSTPSQQPPNYYHNAPAPTSDPPPLPPAPSSFPITNSLSWLTLATVNQTASQKHVSITYQAEPTGPSHTPTWTARCLSKV
ncbi:hypothetical protein D9757_004685 [Collybiopsis confluens]|uniref:RNase III domain-containing protein n=1 Tax=Collybiopsis confluens TaxID=2823264 RepID=A0A8H5HST1_9AGAR|nr:hypothetical protein D9757_004685 [Collybiopsis confluens]